MIAEFTFVIIHVTYEQPASHQDKPLIKQTFILLFVSNFIAL